MTVLPEVPLHSPGATKGQLVGLTSTECLELLMTQRLGRIIYCDDHGPIAVPVNFVVQDDTILFRTSSDNALAQHMRECATCSFEVDEVDEAQHSGWSVLVRGSAAVVRHVSGDRDLVWPTPWPAGRRQLLIRMTPSELRGRRLVAY